MIFILADFVCATEDFTDTESIILYPIGPGYDNWCMYIGYQENWMCVDEDNPDDDASYVQTPEGEFYINNDEELYTIGDHTTQTTAIRSVTILCRVYHENELMQDVANAFHLDLFLEGEINFEAVSENLNELLGFGSWVDLSATWETNPWTGGQWTWDVIDQLQIGFHFEQMMPAPEESIKVTQINLKVDYEAEQQTLPTLQTTIDIKPDMLCYKSKRQNIACYIELPEGYDANNINISSIRLNDEVAVKKNRLKIGDYDDDGVPDLKIKFKINLIKKSINWDEEKTELKITGQFTDGTFFEGYDTINLKNKQPREKKRGCKADL